MGGDVGLIVLLLMMCSLIVGIVREFVYKIIGLGVC